MRERALALLIAIVVVSSACGRGPFLRQYEYEEVIYLDLDGSATVMVNASLLALRVLRGVDVPVDPRARLDTALVRRAFESNGRRVRVGRPWRREGRRFVHVRVEVDDIRKLPAARPFDWSTYSFEQQGELRIFRHVVRGSSEPIELASRSADPRAWNGSERVAFRVHLPSRIQYHNVRDLDTGGPGGVDRGNILTWEQRLVDRLAGTPLEMEARMENQSILYRTLWLFGGAFGAALATLAGLIWWTARKGRAARARA